MRFIAIARVSCASLDKAPCDMLPDIKRLRISVIDSISSNATASPGRLKSNRSRT